MLQLTDAESLSNEVGGSKRSTFISLGKGNRFYRNHGVRWGWEQKGSSGWERDKQLEWRIIWRVTWKPSAGKTPWNL